MGRLAIKSSKIAWLIASSIKNHAKWQSSLALDLVTSQNLLITWAIIMAILLIRGRAAGKQFSNAWIARNTASKWRNFYLLAQWVESQFGLIQTFNEDLRIGKPRWVARRYSKSSAATHRPMALLGWHGMFLASASAGSFSPWSPGASWLIRSSWLILQCELELEQVQVYP